MAAKLMKESEEDTKSLEVRALVCELRWYHCWYEENL